MDELRIRLLGGFRVSVGSRVVDDGEWRLRKAKALVKLLALAPGHRLHREQILDRLWPDLDADAAANQLRKTLHETRRVLDPDPAATYRYLCSGDQLRLVREVTAVDLDTFEDAALEARRLSDPAAYRAAIAAYGGDLLPEDRYEDWVIDREEALRTEFLALLVEHARLLEARAEFDAAAVALRRVLTVDPAHEEAAAGLMRVYVLAGRQHEALREYDRLRAALDREFGTEPSVTTQWLHERIRTGRALEPGLNGELWERIGSLRMISGDAMGATAAYTAALDALHGSGDDKRTARLHRKSAQASLRGHDPATAEGHLRAAETLLARIAGTAGVRVDAERGRLLGVQANWLWETGNFEDAQRAAEQSLRIAERHGRPEDVAAAYETLAIVYHFRGAWQEGLHVEIQRLGADADAVPQLARIFDIHHCIGQYHLYGDALSADVESYARRTLELATRAGATRAEAFAWCLLGEALLLHGQFDEAGACLERSARTEARFGTSACALSWQRLAELAVERGDSEAAAAHVRQAMAITTVSPMAAHMWGRLYATVAFDAVERGDPEAAVRAVRSAAAAEARYGACPTCAALLNPVAAEAFTALDDRESAATYAGAAQRVAELFASSAWRAMAESALGSLALAEHDPAAAHDRFLAAATLYRQAGQPFWEARARFAAATVGLGAADDRELLADATATFERLGATRRLAAARAT